MTFTAKLLHIFGQNFLQKCSLRWLVGCFLFNGPLRQYFSLYLAVSQRKGERKENRRERKCPNNPIRTYCKRSRPLPYYNPNQKDAPALKELAEKPSETDSIKSQISSKTSRGKKDSPKKTPPKKIPAIAR